MGLFSHEREYVRRYRDEAPPGWRTVEAVVSSVERGRSAFRNRKGGGVARTETTYAFIEEDGSVGTITQEKKLSKQPIVGRDVVLAYDPGDPDAEIVLLKDEAETNIARARRYTELMTQGAEAPARVTAVRKTGRTTDDDAKKVETAAKLTVSPADGQPFETEVLSWRDPEVGDDCLWFYAPGDPRGGSPLFATPEARMLGPDGLRWVRQEFLASCQQVLAMARSWKRPESN